jgi:hypothetical protein
VVAGDTLITEVSQQWNKFHGNLVLVHLCGLRLALRFQMVGAFVALLLASDAKRPKSNKRRKERMSKPTVSQILSELYGSDFSRATQEQRLLLVEDIARSLRTGEAWGFNLCAVGSGTSLDLVIVPLYLGRNEGLKLLAILNVAIVEGYSVMVATERGL